MTSGRQFSLAMTCWRLVTRHVSLVTSQCLLSSSSFYRLHLPGWASASSSRCCRSMREHFTPRRRNRLAHRNLFRDAHHLHPIVRPVLRSRRPPSGPHCALIGIIGVIAERLDRPAGKIIRRNRVRPYRSLATRRRARDPAFGSDDPDAPRPLRRARHRSIPL